MYISVFLGPKLVFRLKGGGEFSTLKQPKLVFRLNDGAGGADFIVFDDVEQFVADSGCLREHGGTNLRFLHQTDAANFRKRKTVVELPPDYPTLLAKIGHCQGRNEPLFSS